MEKVRFREEQMVTILRKVDKNPVAEIAKKHQISEQTIGVRRRQFGKLEPADVKRLRELEPKTPSSSGWDQVRSTARGPLTKGRSAGSRE